MIFFKGIFTNLHLEKKQNDNSKSLNFGLNKGSLNSKKKYIIFANKHAFIKDDFVKREKQNCSVKPLTDLSFTEKQVQKLSQNMADYPINQFYILLTEKNYWEGNHRFNKEHNINEDKEAFYKWFSEIVSPGVKKDSALPKIEIDGPTGIKSIREAIENPERVQELMPLYLIACDLYHNPYCLNDDTMTKGILDLAKDHIKQDFGIEINKDVNIEDFNYSKYLEKKNEYLITNDENYLKKKDEYLEKRRVNTEKSKELLESLNN